MRRSPREIERLLDDIDGGGGPGETIDVVHWDEQNQQHVDRAGNPVEADPNADHVVVIKRTLVMEREQAIADGREILGSVEDAAAGQDIVKVAREGDLA